LCAELKVRRFVTLDQFMCICVYRWCKQYKSCDFTCWKLKKWVI